MKHLVFSCLITYMTTIMAILFARPLAIRVGLVDVPTDRKLHTGQIPLIGGIAMLFGLCIGLLTLDMSLVHYRALLGALVFLVFVGVLDDFRELTPRARFYAQIFVACMIILVGKVGIYDLGNLLFIGPIHMGIVGIFFSIVAVIGVINCINMIDGIDGLAGSIVLIQLFYLAVLTFRGNFTNDFMFLMLILSSVLAFLTFNLQIKKNNLNVFMGDAGTMLLGILLVWFLMSLSQVPYQAAKPVAFLWIMALPLFDMVHVVLRRIRRKISPVHADREHLHHYLQRSGWDHRLIVLLLSFLSILLGAVGLLMTYFNWSESIMFILFLLTFVFYCVVFNIFYPIRKDVR